MKVFTQFMLLLLFSLSSFGQINMADSTVSVVGYWAIGDSLSYNVSHVEYKLKGDTAAYDTTEYMKLTYEVDITIKDSTENSYTIEWLYRGHSIQSEDSIIQKLATVLEDIAVLIKTDEFGAVQGIENWEEVRGKINDIATKMAPFFKDIPNGKQLLEEAMNPFQTKEGLEGNLIDDAIQFYTYHGKMYDTDKELKGEVQIQNQVIGKPMDATFNIWLDELDLENDTFIMRYYQAIDSLQLTSATYEHLVELGNLNKNLVKLENFPVLTNDFYIATRIHGSSGWPTYSVQTTITKAEGVENFEERIIQIK